MRRPGSEDPHRRERKFCLGYWVESAQLLIPIMCCLFSSSTNLSLHRIVIVSCFGFGDCGQDCLFTSMRFSFGFSLGVGDENIFNTPTPNEKPNETLVNNCATADCSWYIGITTN